MAKGQPMSQATKDAMKAGRDRKKAEKEAERRKSEADALQDRGGVVVSIPTAENEHLPEEYKEHVAKVPEPATVIAAPPVAAPPKKEKALEDMTDKELADKAARIINLKAIKEYELQERERKEEAEARNIEQNKELVYRQQPQVMFTVPENENQPQVVSVTLDGYSIDLIRGVPKLIPKSHAEHLQFTLNMKKANRANRQKAQKGFKDGTLVTDYDKM